MQAPVRMFVMTLFPDMVLACLSESITGRAMRSGILEISAVNIRDFAGNRHGRVDDYPYGGGAGMVMQAQPVYDCFQWIQGQLSQEEQAHLRKIYLTPQGRIFDQSMARELSGELSVGGCIILLCGHYEGVDERVIEEIGFEELSLGDFVLTGGEIPAMAVCDAVSRLLPGVLHNDASSTGESFEQLDGSGQILLEYPQYTRPAVWRKREVPPILLSGDHAKVDRWREAQALERTQRKRPDLLTENAN